MIRCPLLFCALALFLGTSAASAKTASQLRRQVLSAAKSRLPRAELSERVQLLVRHDEPLVVDALLDLGTRYPRHYALALQRLSDSLGPAGLARLCERSLEARSYRERLLALEACGWREDAASGGTLARAITREDDLGVSRVAVMGARRRRLVAAVAPLIELLGDLEPERSVIRHEVEGALREITGESLRSAEAWRAYWGARGPSFVLPDLAEAEAERELEADDPRRTRLRVTPTFFSVELISDRVVFVIDVSGSMAGERLARVRGQLNALLDQLGEGVRFQLLAYSGVERPRRQGNLTRPLPEKLGGQRWLARSTRTLSRATSSRKAAARRWVAELEAEGATFTSEALWHALRLRGADQVILLSDGQPTEVDRETGRTMSAPEVAERVARLNRFRRLRIDTIDLGGAGDAFLRQVAADNGGHFHRVRPK